MSETEDTSSTTCMGNYEEQLNELEILQSMYPGANELELSDPFIIGDIQEYVRTGRHQPATAVEFTLRLNLEEEHRVESIFNLCRDYPSSALPEIYIRSESWDREAQRKINEDVQTFLRDEVVCGEASLVALISWIQENGLAYFHKNQTKATETLQDKNQTGGGKFSRYWIYSHHIYSKIKRRNILDMAREYDVTGFCQPGKPGIICVEGTTSNCAAWWTVVRNWNWKRLSLKIIEEQEVDNEVSAHRIFNGFAEIGEVKSGNRDYHMDMAQFETFLVQHNCRHIFSELFGLEK